MKTILISGGGGYLGTQLSQSLLKKHKVIIFDTFYFPWILKNKKKIINVHNLRCIKKNISDVKENDFKDVDIVCDLNGISNDPSGELNPKHTWKINYNHRVNFAKVAKKAKVKRYIFNSTCSVYGFSPNKVFENDIKKPISTYAKANLKAENSINKLTNKEFKVNSLRNSTLFGFSNSMRLDLVINIFVLNIMKKKEIIIDGDGNQYRPFISVNDVCKIYEILISKDNLPSFVCNIGSFNSKIKSIAYRICKILNVNKQIIKFKKNSNDKRNYIVGSKNFKKYFGANFKYSKFDLEIKQLKTNLKKYKINYNKNTVRMNFYKDILK
jgi:nucleoside-diphosphate-sugar epimerase